MSGDNIEEVYTGSKVELGWQITVMVVNVVSPFILGGSSGLIMWLTGLLEGRGAGLNSTAGESTTPVSADGWAFSIWGFIYAGLASFVIY